ncbi:hypothetical protein ACT2CC_00475 [Candidatus Vidania fulgoroideorum]
MNYIKFSDFKIKDYKKIFKLSKKFKENIRSNIFSNKNMIMLFNKPSTRTRITFEIGFKEENGNVVFLNKKDSQLSRGESIKDTLRVFSKFFDIIVIRTYIHNEVKKMTKYSNTPIINALTDSYHPCQVASDIFTLLEKTIIKGKLILWVGEKNNVFNTWLDASKIFNFKLEAILPYKKKCSCIKYYRSFKEVKKKYVAIVTDTWDSMSLSKKKKNYLLYKNVKVKKKDLKHTDYFLHCLPAYVGKEIGEKVLDNRKSLVWQCVENKKHVQKGIIYYLINRMYAT